MQRFIPSFLLVITLLASCLLAKPAQAMEAFVVEDIRLQGLQRVSPGTVFNQLPINVGEVDRLSIGWAM